MQTHWQRRDQSSIRLLLFSILLLLPKSGCVFVPFFFFSWLVCVLLIFLISIKEGGRKREIERETERKRERERERG